MLKKETIEAIAKTTGLNAEELAKAISDEQEQDVTIPKLITYSENEWEVFEKKIDDEKKERYESGKKAGVEMLIKEEKESEGLNFDGKSFDAFKKHMKDKILKEAKIEPEKKALELEADLQKVREQVKIFEENEKKIKSEYEVNLKNFKIENHLSGLIPSELKGIDPNDAKLIIKNNFEFDFEGDLFVVKKGGEVMKSKTREPIPPKEAVEEFLKERKYLDIEGRGGKDSDFNGGIGRITSMKQFREYCEKNKMNPSGEQAQIKLSEITKDNKDFDFNG